MFICFDNIQGNMFWEEQLEQTNKEAKSPFGNNFYSQQHIKPK